MTTEPPRDGDLPPELPGDRRAAIEWARDTGWFSKVKRALDVNRYVVDFSLLSAVPRGPPTGVEVYLDVPPLGDRRLTPSTGILDSSLAGLEYRIRHAGINAFRDGDKRGGELEVTIGPVIPDDGRLVAELVHEGAPD